MRVVTKIGLLVIATAITLPLIARAQGNTSDDDNVLRGPPPSTYGQAPGYGEAPTYGNANPSYGQAPTYGDAPTYGQANPTYGQTNPGYGQAPTYGNAPTYGQAPGYGQPSRL